MKLSDLLHGLPGLELGADPGLDIQSLAYDSRRVTPGGLFFAIEGEDADGHRFIPQALERGAAAIVSERSAPAEFEARWVRVAAIRRALSTAGRSFCGHPERSLRLAGITGTNGKTTTAFLLESILRAAGLVTGLFGTIEYHVAARSLPACNTTPESLDLAIYLAELERGGGSAAVMEVSSHALAQERVWGFPFAVAVFTNLTRDHLDYHHTMEEYFRAKRRLFEGLGTSPPEVAAINVDDAWGRRLLELPFARLITYGTGAEASVRVKRFSQDAAGLKAALVTPAGAFEIASPMLGRSNLMNIMAAVAAAQGLGIANDQIRVGVEELATVPGRFERIEQRQPFLVLVDYAHTDEAIRSVLTTAREITRNRLTVVFGCGGDRDRSKRALMGEAAGSLADSVILTSDNPRSEDPLTIMNDALVGIQRTGKPCILEVERESAIRRALSQAHPGDVVVIAGKGHETHQIFEARTVPFDDREVARRVLNDLGYAPGAADERS
ncbi:MAG TPA: UDP-N-acetylmuramoyl-L-alanyl-D-glutamate--2,6-diaminopimelate ligase [Terriglobia bacterium]|nr:UDP-N-acetylmuramoyl-L-alanyl-D-glutamate--2,6-diaminopimelate ligase [Terriglobia bacterium]